MRENYLAALMYIMSCSSLIQLDDHTAASLSSHFSGISSGATSFMNVGSTA